MLLAIIDNISSFIYRLTTNGLTSDLIFYLSVGFIGLFIVFFLFKSRYAYEGRLERALENINRWLYRNQQIDESNLVEFNRLIKRAPRLLRYHWQQYMLYREHEPSYYMSMYNCIEKPLHTSSYTSNIKNFIGISALTMFTSFVVSLLSYGSVTFTVETFANSLLIPVIILVISVIFLVLLRAMQNFSLASLYQNFHLFNRYVDKASTTIPKYVDFEILFTRKEIRGGIPVLNEYLEKRARQEVEELEKARQNAIEHEVYSFENAGIDGSLILDRAMKESEIYLNSRQRLLTQIQQYDSEIDSLKRNYENTSKDYQRKLQASKENVERLRQQQEESTNRIEVNYIRKQQQDEIKKQEQLEKDQDDATLRFNQETATLQEQIDKCRAELEEKKSYATTAMLSEYDTFSTKLFKAILKDVEGKHKAEIDELAGQKVEALKELEKEKEINNIKDGVINDLREIIHQREAGIEPGKDVDEILSQYESETAAQTAAQELPVEETAAQEQAEPAQEVNKEELVEEAPQEEQPAQEQDGFYDENGYYCFYDGTFYDDKGLYHANDGKIYDQQGNLVESNDEPKPETEAVAEEVPQEEAPAEEVPQEEQPAVEEVPAQETAVEPEQQEALVEEQPAEEAPQEEAPAEEEGEAQEKRGRGRPKKETTEEEGEPQEKKGRGRPKKEATEEEGEPQEKKGRGRPKKEVTEDAEPQEKKGRGRPKKEVTEDEGESQEKKGRGRPKKEVTEEAEPQEKKGRGRPKKETTEEAGEPQEKKGRGRPKKSE